MLNMKVMAPQHDISCREGNSWMHYDKLSYKKNQKLHEFREMLIIISVYLGCIQIKKENLKGKLLFYPKCMCYVFLA